jgi:rare lipoprotein A
MFYRFAIVLFSCFLLTACTETELVSHWWKNLGSRDGSSTGSSSARQQQGNFKVGRPYHAMGKWYTPSESYSYDEAGIASWYGDQFHGKKTANGEVFDKNAMTAAHPTLQLPSLVRVTNLENGRSTVLRVNDRGPFKRNRVIDVSHRAADVLGFTANGTAKVRVQVLDRESRLLAEAAKKGYPAKIQMAMAFRREPEEAGVQVASAATSSMPTVPSPTVSSNDLPSPSGTAQVSNEDLADLDKQLFRKFPVSPTNIFVQVGSFTNVNNANALKPKLNSLGNVNVYPTMVGGRQFHRVRIGPIGSVGQADTVLSRTISAGYPSARIIVD